MTVLNEKIKRSMLAHFLDTSMGATTPVWTRIRKTTAASVDLNAQTTTEQYIDQDGPETSVDRYEPSLSTTLVAFKGDPVFDAVFNIYKNRSTGADTKTKYLEVYIWDKTEGETPTYGAALNDCTIVVQSIGDSAEDPLSIEFEIQINETPTIGTVTITDGVPTFTAA